MALLKVLVIRFGGMGDILMATPSIRAIAARYPESVIDVVVGGGMTASVSGHRCIRNIYTFNKRGRDSSFLPFAGFLGKLWRERYDVVINLHPSVKSYLMALASRPGRIVSFRKQMLAQNGNAIHAIDDFAKELRPLGIDGVSDRVMDFFVPEDAVRSVAKCLDGLGVRPADRIVVINPAASRPINRWPTERFRKVASHFAGLPNTRVFVTGAPSSHRSIIDSLDEVALAAGICSADPRIVDLAGKLTVKELGALLMRASVFLTCDTGPMHIAAALRTPMVVLSGAADPARTGPLTDNAVVLIDRSLPCVPCRDRICGRGDVKCMDNLSEEMVVQAIDRLLEGIGTNAYVQRLRIVS